MMKPVIEINGRKIGPGHDTYVIAELSGNHNGDFDRAVALVKAAKESGADAAKLQTYTADTLTIDSDAAPFQVPVNNTWAGETLHSLYRQAYTPWEWQPKLKALADDLGIDLFSSPFDKSAVDLLVKMDVPALKVASFELVDIALVEYIAGQGKPVIMSTGLSVLPEVVEGVEAVRRAGNDELALLKCNSGYPALPEEAHLPTIPHMAEMFGVPVGYSDHTLGIGVPIAAVALGACIVEKHITLSRADGGPDAAFSLEPAELTALVTGIRQADQALNGVSYEPTPKEEHNRIFRRSLFVVQDVAQGERLTDRNVRSIRPGNGLLPKYLPQVLGRTAARSLKRGTPLDWPDLGTGQGED